MKYDPTVFGLVFLFGFEAFFSKGIFKWHLPFFGEDGGMYMWHLPSFGGGRGGLVPWIVFLVL